MKKIIQVHIHKGDTYLVAECLDLPVVTQGRTLDELVENLKEAIALQLEDENAARVFFIQLMKYTETSVKKFIHNLFINGLRKASFSYYGI